jgi:hypothetical protein
MKVLRFFPLAFISNVHGFVLFAPLMGIFLAITHLSRRRPVPIAIAVK